MKIRSAISDQVKLSTDMEHQFLALKMQLLAITEKRSRKPQLGFAWRIMLRGAVFRAAKRLIKDNHELKMIEFY